MAVLSPVKKLSASYMTMIVAMVLLMPSMSLFCLVHAPKSPVAERVSIQIEAPAIEQKCEYCTAMHLCAKHNRVSCMVAPDMVALTFPAPPGTVSTGDPNQGNLSPGAVQTAILVPFPSCDGIGRTSLVQQQAEQNTPAIAQYIQQQLQPEVVVSNDTYDGLSSFGADDIVSNLFSNIGQLIGKAVFEMPLQIGATLSLFLCLWIAPQVVLTKL